MMAIVPSRQFQPAATFFDSFQTSSKFHGTRLQFFRYGSSVHFTTLFLTANRKVIAFDSISERNSLKKSNFASINRPINLDSFNKNLCTRSWIDKWNQPQHRHRPKPPRAALNYRNTGSENESRLGYVNSDNNSGSGSGSGGGSTMERIVEKLKKFGYVDDGIGKQEKATQRVLEKGSVEDIFYVEEGMLPNTRGGFSPKSPLGIENAFGGDGEVRFPWEKPKEKEEETRSLVRRKSRTSLAELTLPESELRRLKNLTFQKKHKTRIGGGGVTQAVVDTIHEKWKTSEIVRLKFEGAAALNMRRMHEILERKTGGLVIWRSGNSVSLYRGVSYEVPSVHLNKRIYKKNEINTSLQVPSDKAVRSPSDFVSNIGAHTPSETSETPYIDQKERGSLPEVKYEDEIDKLLDDLGPRYTDWPGCDPLPVDADMLPGTVPGYEPPFRVLPYGVRASLGRNEATSLRRVARGLPPHFALGRNRQLQGLAVAMIKLWEKSSIAKVALKRGVQLTTSERMAEEIKKLTGGTLLSRNKDFLVFYRGKNFLSPDVTEALLERERLAKTLQDDEEQARLRAAALVIPSNDISEQSGTAGTLGETLDADAKWGKRLDDHHKEKMMRKAELLRHSDLVRKLERNLAFAERKLARAGRALAKVEQFLKPAERQADPTSITDEERFMFRKLGLRMKAFLLLGRRGVFDGTVENMHLHWKYRELIKIIVKAKTFEQVKKVALALEAESGGVLVSVDRISKGYAVIVFRGKDYQRPSTLRPKNLLTKRKALARSIELQRHEALLNHISVLQSKVDKIRCQIDQIDLVKDQGDEALYDKIDSSYSTDDEEPTDNEETEEEGDEAYLEMYNSEYDDGDESDNSIDNLQNETNFPYGIQNREQDETREPELHAS